MRARRGGRTVPAMIHEPTHRTHADLAFTGVAEQARLVRSGEVTPRALVEHSLELIERLDPKLSAFRCVMAERARADADAAQARLAAGDDAPLLGVPVAVKDNVDVTGELTCHGTAAVEHTGQPAAAIPAGFDDDGLPLSVQLVVRPGEDAMLVSLAAQLERAIGTTHRRPPVA
jgi:Asp-tRNA(Asn)/Glu-tRNA(Gln) amidotransferase A subunit family amidase